MPSYQLIQYLRQWKILNEERRANLQICPTLVNLLIDKNRLGKSRGFCTTLLAQTGRARYNAANRFQGFAVRRKLLLAYDILPDHQDEYMNFMVNIFVPTLQRIGLANAGVWHTAYGDYPSRLIVFVSDDEPTMERALAGKTWKDLEGRLKQHVRDYTRRVVPFQPGFQF